MGPLTYSIAYGIIGGVMVWVALQVTFWVLSLFGIKREGADEEEDAQVVAKSLSETTDEDDSNVKKGNELTIARGDCEEVEMDDRRASLADMRMVSENNQSLRLGGGALVSFPVKYIHPHNVRDNAYPVRQSGQRL